MRLWAVFKNFIFLLTYEYFQQAGVLDHNRPEKLSGDKHSNLLAHSILMKEIEWSEYGPWSRIHNTSFSL